MSFVSAIDPTNGTVHTKSVGQKFVSEGGLQPASLGSNPAHVIVYKVEPP